MTGGEGRTRSRRRREGEEEKCVPYALKKNTGFSGNQIVLKIKESDVFFERGGCSRIGGRRSNLLELRGGGSRD